MPSSIFDLNLHHGPAAGKPPEFIRNRGCRGPTPVGEAETVTSMPPLNKYEEGEIIYLQTQPKRQVFIKENGNWKLIYDFLLGVVVSRPDSSVCLHEKWIIDNLADGKEVCERCGMLREDLTADRQERAAQREIAAQEEVYELPMWEEQC